MAKDVRTSLIVTENSVYESIVCKSSNRQGVHDPTVSRKLLLFHNNIDGSLNFVKDYHLGNL